MVDGILICDGDPEIRGAMQRTARGDGVPETALPCETLDIDVTAFGVPGLPGVPGGG